MEVRVDLATAAVTIEDPDDVRSLRVLALHGPDEDTGSPVALAGVAASLAVHHLGRVELDGHAYLDRDALRAAARSARGADEGEDASGWEAEFDAMMAFAAEHGWVDDGGAVRAHLEWELV